MITKNNDFGFFSGANLVCTKGAVEVLGIGTCSTYRIYNNNSVTGQFGAALSGCCNTIINSFGVITGGKKNSSGNNAATTTETFIGTGASNNFNFRQIIASLTCISFTGSVVCPNSGYVNLTPCSTTGSGYGACLQVVFTAGVPSIAVGFGSGGVGYQVGDCLTIPGTQFGLLSPANDLVARVNTVSCIIPTTDGILNGINNKIRDTNASIGGGQNNIIDNASGFILGGCNNFLNANFSFFNSLLIGCCLQGAAQYGAQINGFCNTISDCNIYTIILNGECNSTTGVCPPVIGAPGGTSNSLSGCKNIITGGGVLNLGGLCNCNNNANGGSVLNGFCNRVCLPTAVVNVISNCQAFSTIINGVCNTINSCLSTAFGICNNVTGCITAAFGCEITASCNLTFYNNNHCTCGYFYTACITDKCAVCSNNGQLVGYTPFTPANRGYFYDTTNQLPALINTAYPMQVNTTDAVTNGFSVANDTFGNPVRITATKKGIYNVQYSAQIEKKTGGINKFLNIWISCNGIDIPNSNKKYGIKANANYLLPADNFLISLNATDYFSIMYSVTDTNIHIVCVNSTALSPATPSVIISASEVILT